jgi:hypothetical protein
MRLLYAVTRDRRDLQGISRPPTAYLRLNGPDFSKNGLHKT